MDKSLRKAIRRSGAVGMLAGVAANELIALAVSHALHFGYYMPCLAALPERVGGELNAVGLQMLACAGIGACVGVLWRVARHARRRRAR